MQRLLNFSIHPGEPEMFDNDWQQAARFLERWEFDGLELFPVGDWVTPAFRGGVDAACIRDTFARQLNLARQTGCVHVRDSHRKSEPHRNARTFRQRLDIARRHVGCIDRHNPFEELHVAAVLEITAPDQVVFEFTFNGMVQWKSKIALQKNVLLNYL